MFKVSVVDECPHTEVVGQLHLPHYMIAALAGAVHDKEEWMAMIKGTRSEDGLIIRATQFKVPDHYRSASYVELMRKEPLTPDIVGVVHSHHSFGAFFSQTDYNELNSRFPMSLVVAHSRRSSNDECYSLGFDYAAEGKITLPCGSVGNINFVVVPNPAPTGWGVPKAPNFETPKVEMGLCDCNRVTSKKTKTHEALTTACGLEFTRALPMIFGDKDNLIMPQVLKHSKPLPVTVYQGGRMESYPNGRPQYDFSPSTQFEERGPNKKVRALPGWNEVPEDKRNPNNDQWGYWGIDGRYHFYNDYGV